MKKIIFEDLNLKQKEDFIEDIFNESDNKSDFIANAKKRLEDLPIVFYDYIGIILKHIGFRNPHITREGDVNCRMDAIIIDADFSIPIEIKSPREVREINIKSIRQAVENKVVLLSRKFHPTTYETTSLAIAFEYPPERSDVYELISDVKNAFGFNIGIVNIDDLLNLVYDIDKDNKTLDLTYFNTLMGKLNYEKTLI